MYKRKLEIILLELKSEVIDHVKIWSCLYHFGQVTEFFSIIYFICQISEITDVYVLILNCPIKFKHHLKKQIDKVDFKNDQIIWIWEKIASPSL